MPAPASPPSLIDRPERLAEVLAAVQAADRVAIDTEFHGERSYYPRLMLLQVATDQGIWLVDPLALDLRELVHAMAAPGKLLIGHALKNDLRILVQTYAAPFTAVFDTQLAAAFLGCGLQVGLSHLVYKVMGVQMAKGEQMADWNQRPLPPKLREYAANDVAHLLAIYDLQARQLAELGRTEWLQQECAALCDADLYARDPEAAGDRIAGARRLDPVEGGVLYAVAALRERMAQEDNVVPHFLIGDDALLTLAKCKPRSAREIHGDRRLQMRAIQKHAELWVQAVSDGLAKPLRRPAGRPPPPPQLEAVASAAMLLVADLAETHGIAPQLLAKRDAVLDALRQAPRSAHDLAGAAGLHGWRHGMVAEPLWAWLTGKLLLRCEPCPDHGFKVAVAGALP